MGSFRPQHDRHRYRNDPHHAVESQSQRLDAIEELLRSHSTALEAVRLHPVLPDYTPFTTLGANPSGVDPEDSILRVDASPSLPLWPVNPPNVKATHDESRPPSQYL